MIGTALFPRGHSRFYATSASAVTGAGNGYHSCSSLPVSKITVRRQYPLHCHQPRQSTAAVTVTVRFMDITIAFVAVLRCGIHTRVQWGADVLAKPSLSRGDEKVRVGFVVIFGDFLMCLFLG